MVQEQTNQQTTDISQDAREDWEASYDDMTRLYEETLRDIQEGEVVKGTVVKITPDYVLVDVGISRRAKFPSKNSRTMKATSRSRRTIKSKCSWSDEKMKTGWWFF
ncbi:MAG TPA: hypothetical protein PLG17_09615, partial [Thermodesulfobacteriota bacterium]|nr:hypothetical protein [Thermodesulfobacteriota bacterium]